MSRNFKVKKKEDNKEEIKSRVFISFESQEDKCLKSFDLPQDTFENILYNFTQEVEDFKNRTIKNGYKIYVHKNINFKIFNDGSCFVYVNKESSITKLNIPMDNINFYLTVSKNRQIMSDEFPGLKNYNYETIFEEIILKLNDNINLIFSKNDKGEYAIYFEKNLSSLTEKFDLSEFSEVLNLISK